MTARLTLAAGEWEAALLPEQGGAFASLRHAGRDLLVPVPLAGAALGLVVGVPTVQWYLGVALA